MPSQEVTDMLNSFSAYYSSANKAKKINTYNLIQQTLNGDETLINSLRNLLEKLGGDSENKQALYDGLMVIYNTEHTT